MINPIPEGEVVQSDSKCLAYGIELNKNRHSFLERSLASSGS